MLSVSSLIDFLMNLMRDENAKEEFDQDPEGTLSRHDLDGISGQDVRDARLIMADNGGVRPRSDHGSGSGSGTRYDDPVREIQHTTNNYVIHEGPSVGSVDQTFNVINIDDRDTTVVDSFNSADTTEVNSVAIQDNSQTNTDIDVIDIEDSFNEESTDEDEPSGEESEAGNDPVDGTPGEEPEVGVDPVDTTPDEEPEVSIDPVDTTPSEEPEVSIDPIESEPDLDQPDVEAAVI